MLWKSALLVVLHIMHRHKNVLAAGHWLCAPYSHVDETWIWVEVTHYSNSDYCMKEGYLYFHINKSVILLVLVIYHPM